jgi:DNA (cytosine-5)-methyltransferase 1
MKVLNLYAGIGGNRKLWTDVEVTAVELDENIAKVYHDFFPNDRLITGDAHKYLLDHFNEFDFIWSSPPCPTHSRARFWSSKGGMYPIVYPEMALYQEIILLRNFYQGLWLVENVKPYYPPLIEPKTELGRHLFWSNFKITYVVSESNYIFNGKDKDRVVKMLGFSLDNYDISDKTKILRNCVHPEIGSHILDCARNVIRIKNIQEQLLF